MRAAGVFIVCLSILSVHGQEYYGYDYGDYVPPPETPPVNTNVGVPDLSWLYSLLGQSACTPGTCLNGGFCDSQYNTAFVCVCLPPYTGNRCQTVKNVCKDVSCGRGDCVVNLNKYPFYECKCTPPYEGPNCRILPSLLNVCNPNPCKNGGSCIQGNRRFFCACPDGYSGSFCQIAPNDCYEGNGASYRGAACMTESGQQCLNWHSYFILAHAEDPFTMYPNFTGLGRNNHCRNPDNDAKPWCHIKKDNALTWEYCKIKKCAGAPVTPTTEVTEAPGSSQFSQCGVAQTFRTGRIYGGSKSLPGAHPWQVSVQDRPTFNPGSRFGHQCGGILIRSCWVLTAAHCISPNRQIQVVMGGVNIDKPEDIDQTIPVVKTIVHENYRETPQALYNDIALLKLKPTDTNGNCATESQFVKTACLPDQVFPAGKECVISGWGATEGSRHSSHLLNARVLLIGDEPCKAPHVYGNSLDSSMFCAGQLSGGVDSCQGDSGGPLVCEQNGTHYITGVVSWGHGCGVRNKPGVYANVHGFIDWINNKINSN